jgi:hypothetical protein
MASAFVSSVFSMTGRNSWHGGMPMEPDMSLKTGLQLQKFHDMKPREPGIEFPAM